MKREDILKILQTDGSEILKRIEKNDEERDLIGELLAVSEDSSLDKTQRKNARKILYILRSRGYRIDKPRKKISISNVGDKEGMGNSKIDDKVFNLRDAYITVPDIDANYVIAFLISNASETMYRFHFFLCNHWNGLIEEHVENSISKKRAIQIIESKEEFFNPGVEYTLYRLKREIGKSNDKKVLKGKLPEYLVYRESSEPSHPILSLSAGLLNLIYTEEQAKMVFASKEVSAITLPQDTVENVLSEIKKVRSSRLIVSNMSPSQRVEHIIDKFVLTFFTSERLKTLQEIAFDVAYFLKDDKPEVSKILASWGIELLRPDVNIRQNLLVGFLIFKHFLAPFSRENTSAGNIIIPP